LESIKQLLEDTLTSYEKKEYDTAEKLVVILLNENPQFHRGWFLKGVILEETDRKEEAEQCFKKAGSLFNMWFRLALQLQESDPVRSLKYYERVLEMDHTFRMAWLNKGIIHERLGDIENAKLCFKTLSPLRELFSRIAIPSGFFLFLLIGGIMMVSRGERMLSLFAFASAVICLFWLKRDAGAAITMLRKKRQYS
jgi:tetratricopeptide (TPR) repeat protein